MSATRIDSLILFCPTLKEARVFSISHAERLLRLKSSCWELPADSNFEFDKENGLRLRANKRNNVSPQKEGANNRSSKI